MNSPFESKSVMDEWSMHVNRIELELEKLLSKEEIAKYDGNPYMKEVTMGRPKPNDIFVRWYRLSDPDETTLLYRFMWREHLGGWSGKAVTSERDLETEPEDYA
jgi:hypothetical protein